MAVVHDKGSHEGEHVGQSHLADKSFEPNDTEARRDIGSSLLVMLKRDPRHCMNSSPFPNIWSVADELEAHWMRDVGDLVGTSSNSGAF